MRFGAFCAPCCHCEDCCNGDWPDEFQVSLAVVGQDCDECGDTIYGNYILQKFQGAYGPCEWQFGDVGQNAPGDGYCEPGCTSPYVESRCPTVSDVFIRLQISCASLTEYQVSVELFIEGSFFPGNASGCGVAYGDRATYLNRYVWYGLIPRSLGECSAFTGELVPYHHRDCWCGSPFVAANHTCGPGYEFWACNDSPSSAVLNAI